MTNLKHGSLRAIRPEFVEAYEAYTAAKSKAGSWQHPLDGCGVAEYKEALKAIGIDSVGKLKEVLGCGDSTADDKYAHPSSITEKDLVKLREIIEAKDDEFHVRHCALDTKRSDPWETIVKNASEQYRIRRAEATFAEDTHCLRVAKAYEDYFEAAHTELCCRLLSDGLSLLQRSEGVYDPKTYMLRTLDLLLTDEKHALEFWRNDSEQELKTLQEAIKSSHANYADNSLEYPQELAQSDEDALQSTQLSIDEANKKLGAIEELSMLIHAAIADKADEGTPYDVIAAVCGFGKALGLNDKGKEQALAEYVRGR